MVDLNDPDDHRLHCGSREAHNAIRPSGSKRGMGPFRIPTLSGKR